MKLLSEGSESKIYELKNNVLKKVRIKKNYRDNNLDNLLRKKRNRSEFKILKLLEKNKIGCQNPIKIFENPKKQNYYFTYKKVFGIPLKQTLKKENLFLAFEEIIKIHNLNVIHFDLTTLNFLYSKKDNKVVLIDFGLSFMSKKIEDKGVDLDLFFENLKNEHNNFYKYKKQLLKIYEKKTIEGKKILEKLKEIEIRGRNKNK